MSEFPYSLLEEFEQLVESDKEKSLNTTTANSASFQDAIRPSDRQQFDTTTANTPMYGAYQDLALRPQKKRRFQWWQIWEMEECFQENSNPDEVQRQLLSNKIMLPTSDIQLWFQNRRSQPKIVDDLILEMEKLQVEIKTIKQIICHITCQNCGHGVVLDVTPSTVVSSSLLDSEGRASSFLGRTPAPSGSFKGSRNMEFVDRPRSHSKGDAWAGPSDDGRGFQGSREGDAWAGPSDDGRGFQGSREGGFIGNR